MSTSSLRRQVKNIVHNYSEAEIKVLCYLAYLFFFLLRFVFFFHIRTPKHPCFNGTLRLTWHCVTADNLLLPRYCAPVAVKSNDLISSLIFLKLIFRTLWSNYDIMQKWLLLLSHADNLFWPFVVLLCRLERRHPMTLGAPAALWCQRSLT